MAFMKYVPKKAAKEEQKKVHVATVKPSGYIAFSNETLGEFGIGDAAFAVLYFDPRKKRIGVHFTADSNDEGALKVVRRRSSAGVQAAGFFEEFRFVLEDLEKPVKCPVHHDPKTGYVIVDVSAIPRKRGRRSA